MKRPITGTSEPLSGAQDRLDDLEQQLDSRMRDIEIEVASRRSQEKVLIYLGYAAVAAGILIGLFGISEVSDIDNTVVSKITAKTAEIDNKLENVDIRIQAAERSLKNSIDNSLQTLDLRIDNKIASYVDTNESRLAAFKELGTKMNSAVSNFEEIEMHWENTIKPKLQGLDAEDPDADLKGRYLRVEEESALPDWNRPSDWRIRATGVIVRITEQLSTAAADPDFIPQFDPSDLFNVAQLARRLGRFDLERNLTYAAYNADASAASRALYLQSEAQYLRGTESETAFVELLDMVRNLTLDAPHIVVAEAWNAAESLRRYGDLIEAIEDLVKLHKTNPDTFLPSHVYAIKGNAHQRRGLPGDLEKAVSAYSIAVERLEAEGLLSQWGHSTINDTMKYIEVLHESGADTSLLDSAIDRSHVLPLRILYEESRMPNSDQSASLQDDSAQPDMPPELLELLQMLEEEQPN